MADRETTIKGLEPIIGCAKQEKWGAWIDTLEDALELLKDQEDVSNALVDQCDRVRRLRKELAERPQIVRCKDCKHVCMCDTTEMMPDIPVYAKCTLTDEVHEPEWFCADGEARQ